MDINFYLNCLHGVLLIYIDILDLDDTKNYENKEIKQLFFD